jgi:Methyltransferase domain
MIRRIRSVARRIALGIAKVTPGVGTQLKELDELRQKDSRQSHYPPGHYYSTIPEWNSVRSQVGKKIDDLRLWGINLNEEKQLGLIRSFGESLGDDFWAKGGRLLGPRYSWPNNYFHWTDAGLLTHIISHYRPRRIVEVGCGFSSAVVSDALVRSKLDLPAGRTLVDPSFTRLKSLIPSDEIAQLTLHEKVVQEVDVKEFLSLSAGDILIIDSSHITKHGSDVNFLIFDILPQLASGVVVHFHDIFVPFDYPPNWYQERRGYNEAFLVRAFLQFNSDFEIIAFADFLRHRWPAETSAAVGGIAGPSSPIEAVSYASLWLKKK